MQTLSEEVIDLVKKRKPRFNRVFRDCGIYKILDLNGSELYKLYGKQLSLDSVACIATDIFINDERVTNVMAVRAELNKTKTMFKTDFSMILADKLSIGRNKAMALLDQLILGEYFLIAPNICDVNAKLIRPAKISDDELHQMYVRICGVNDTPVTKEGFSIFKGERNDN